MAIRNDHNVYILGAGFSHEEGLPLVSNFLERMRDAGDWLASKGRRCEAEAIEKVFTYRLQAAAAAYRVKIDVENIEELFSLASAEGGQLQDAMTLAIAATLDYCQESHRHRNISVSLEKSRIQGTRLSKARIGIKDGNQGKVFAAEPVLICAAGMLGFYGEAEASENTFITFNYDVLLEEALKRLLVPFHYGLGDGVVIHDPNVDGTSATRVLKLHGSVNWSRDGQLNVHGRYGEVLDAGHTPVLVPPTWRKEFFPELMNVWDAALVAIRSATRIVMVGFSMPPTDMHVKYLLAAGLRENVSLRKIVFVNPDEEGIRKRALAILRGELEARGTVEFVESDALTAFLSTPPLVDIGRPSSFRPG